LDPGWVEAQCGLGAFYVDDQPDLALEYFNRALLLEPQSSYATLGKTAVLLNLNRPTEAEQEARRTLQLSPGLPQAHFLLGVALLMQEKVTPEAATHLKMAAPKVPQARNYLAETEAALAKNERH
jgi:tetratricopeptide (TPR) repeat protein